MSIITMRVLRQRAHMYRQVSLQLLIVVSIASFLSACGPVKRELCRLCQEEYTTMPTITGTEAVAANATSENVLQGKLYRFVPRGTSVVLSATATAAGLNASMLNGVPVVDDQEISDANRFPVVPDDMLTTFRAPGGELILRFRNTTGAAITAKWRVDLQ